MTDENRATEDILRDMLQHWSVGMERTEHGAVFVWWWSSGGYPQGEATGATLHEALVAAANKFHRPA